MVKTNILILAVKNFRGEKKMTDYYLVFPSGEKIYAFSKAYTDNTYNLCKGGVRLKTLLFKRSQDAGVMSLVKKIKFMLPYFKEEYDVA